MNADKNHYKIFFFLLFAVSMSCVGCDDSEDRREDNSYSDDWKDTADNTFPEDSSKDDDSDNNTHEYDTAPETDDEIEVKNIDADDLVKANIDASSKSLANIASFLGYGWPAGCCGWDELSTNVVEMEGGWRLKTTEECCNELNGYMDDNRLEIGYKNFQLVYDNIEIDWANKTESELVPLIAGGATYKNLTGKEGDAEAQIEIRDVESVGLSSSHSFSNAKKYGISIENKIKSDLLAAGTEHSINVNWEQTFTDTITHGRSTTESQWQRQTWKAKIPMPAKKKLQIYAVAYRVKTSIPYKAKVKFINEIELDGFMRWGGGINGDSRNFHVVYEGSGDRPDVVESWGDTENLIPFHQHIKDQSYNWVAGSWTEGVFNWKKANDNYNGALIKWVDYLYANMNRIQTTEIRGNLVFKKSYRFVIVIDDYYDLDEAIESKTEGSPYTETPTSDRTLDVVQPSDTKPEDSN